MIPNVMDRERTYMLSQQNLPFKQIARQGKSYYNSTIMNNRDPSSNQNNSHQICCYNIGSELVKASPTTPKVIAPKTRVSGSL